MVQHTNQIDHQSTHNGECEQKDSGTKGKSTKSPSTGGQTQVAFDQSLRAKLRHRGFSKRVASVMYQARRAPTRKQYAVYLKKWDEYCNKKRVSSTKASVSKALDFMEDLRLAHNLSYSTMNVVRSALSAVIKPFHGLTFGAHPDTIVYMKGVFQISPKVPKYNTIWDLNDVVNHLKSISPAAKLTLKDLSLKVATLLLIVSGQRIQTLSLLNLDHCKISQNSIKFFVLENVKQSRPGAPALEVELKQFPADKRLCVVNYLREYIKRTRHVRQSPYLFVSYRKPHAQKRNHSSLGQTNSVSCRCRYHSLCSA